jgi:hypothetical protein
VRNERKTEISRRAFLTRAGVSAGAAGAAVAVLGGKGEAQAAKPVGGRAVAGYRETDHVRRAYALSRF